MDQNLSVGTRAQMIVERTIAFLKAARAEALISLLGLTALAVAVDFFAIYRGDETVGTIGFNVAQVIVFYYLLLGLVRKNGLREGPITAGGTYFGIAILSGLAILFGFLLLILPGIFLMVRWAPVYGYALVEGAGVSESFSRSMSDTQDDRWAILIAFLLPFACYVIGAVGYFIGFGENIVLFEPFVIAGNLMLYAGSIIFTAMGIAIYSLINQDSSELASVFE